jgi:sensor histidine kinase regulating citrate/malate metabolism
MARMIPLTGMTEAWFKAAVQRASADGCTLEMQTDEQRKAKEVTVRGSKGDCYTVTRTTCTCRGHQEFGRCKHRALAIAHFDRMYDEAQQRKAALRRDAEVRAIMAQDASLTYGTARAKVLRHEFNSRLATITGR